MTNDPAWLAAARAHLGTREYPGPTNNNRLLALLNTAARFNGFTWTRDAVPWCGGFVAACMVAAGIEPPKIAARARTWATWGANLRPTHLALGAVLVFQREGGGHVGFYVGEDSTAYHVLGGNQQDAVTITRIAKSRLIASRWPRGVPVIGGPVRMSAVAGIPSVAGMPLSRNEA